MSQISRGMTTLLMNIILESSENEMLQAGLHGELDVKGVYLTDSLQRIMTALAAFPPLGNNQGEA